MLRGEVAWSPAGETGPGSPVLGTSLGCRRWRAHRTHRAGGRGRHGDSSAGMPALRLRGAPGAQARMPLGEEPQSPRLSRDFITKPQAQPGQSRKGTGRGGHRWPSRPARRPGAQSVLGQPGPGLGPLPAGGQCACRCPPGQAPTSWSRASASGISCSRTLCPRGRTRAWPPLTTPGSHGRLCLPWEGRHSRMDGGDSGGCRVRAGDGKQRPRQ